MAFSSVNGKGNILCPCLSAPLLSDGRVPVLFSVAIHTDCRDACHTCLRSEWPRSTQPCDFPLPWTGRWPTSHHCVCKALHTSAKKHWTVCIYSCVFKASGFSEITTCRKGKNTNRILLMCRLEWEWTVSSLEFLNRSQIVLSFACFQYIFKCFHKVKHKSCIS